MPAAANITNPTDYSGSYREKIHNEFAEFFETEAILYEALMSATDSDGEIGPYGLRIPVVDSPSGGASSYTLDSPSFGRPVSPKTTFMLAAPVGSAWPITMLGRSIAMLKKGDGQTRLNLKYHLDAALRGFTKWTNILCHGDRLGALAYAAGALGAGVGQTLTCETTPTANYGHEKGAARLMKNITYDSVNPTTNVVNGQIYVEVENFNRAQTRVTVTGTVANGDAIVERGTWKLCQAGLAHLIGNHQRNLQGLDTSLFASLTDPTIDLGDTTLTPAAFLSIRAALWTRTGKEDAMKGTKAVLAPGQYAQLAAQGFGIRQSNANENTSYGLPEKYQQNGVDFIIDPDAEDSRVVLFKGDAIKRLTEKEMGPQEIDGDWKNWQGTNEAGSDVFSKALTMVWNLAKVKVRSAALIKRAAISGIVTQASGAF